jgi:hypothetical protein
MAIAIYNSVRSGQDWPISSTRTQSFDVGGGSDRLLIAFTATPSTSGVQVVNGCTYAGVSMNALTAGTHTSGWRWKMFYLAAPTTGTNNIVFTYGDGNAQWNITAAALTGCDQATSIRGGTVVNNSGSATTATWNVSSASGDLVVAMWRLLTGSQAITEGSGTTSMFGTSANTYHGMYEDGASGTVTISATYASSQEVGGSAVSVIPAASAATGKEKLLMLGIG